MRSQAQYLELALGPALDTVADFDRATPASKVKKNPS